MAAPWGSLKKRALRSLSLEKPVSRPCLESRPHRFYITASLKLEAGSRLRRKSSVKGIMSPSWDKPAYRFRKKQGLQKHRTLTINPTMTG